MEAGQEKEVALCRRHGPGHYPNASSWCVDPKNPTIAIDPTWSESLVPGEQRVYIGVPFNLKAVGEARKRETCMLDNWQGGFPLYTGELKETEWRINETH